MRQFVESFLPTAEEGAMTRLLEAGDEASLRKALEIEPGHEGAVVALAELLSRSGADGAADEALALLERIPESAETRQVARSPAWAPRARRVRRRPRCPPRRPARPGEGRRGRPPGARRRPGAAQAGRSPDGRVPQEADVPPLLTGRGEVRLDAVVAMLRMRSQRTRSVRRLELGVRRCMVRGSSVPGCRARLPDQQRRHGGARRRVPPGPS